MIEPLWNQVVVVREFVGVVGGIQLSDKSIKSYRMTVAAVGPDVKHVKKGDMIIALPTDCHFYGNFEGVEKDVGIIKEDKIEGRVK